MAIVTVGTIAAIATPGGAIGNDAVLNSRRCVNPAKYCASKDTPPGHAVPITLVRIAVKTITTIQIKSPDGKTVQHRIRVHTVNAKSWPNQTTRTGLLHLNNCSCHHTGVVGIGAGYSYSFAIDNKTPNSKIWLVARGNNNYIAVTGIINSLLEICVITGDIKNPRRIKLNFNYMKLSASRVYYIKGRNHSYRIGKQRREVIVAAVPYSAI
jgi:hypothetical protein